MVYLIKWPVSEYEKGISLTQPFLLLIPIIVLVADQFVTAGTCR